MRPLAAAAVALAFAAPLPGQAADPSPGEACAGGSGPSVEAGWIAYRAGRMEDAAARFGDALSCDPGAIDAVAGLGYVALRRGRDARARARLEAVLAARPDHVDALVGRALLAWRGGDVDRAGALARRALALAPEYEEAHALAERVAARAAPRKSPARDARGPLVLPDTLVYPARAAGDRLEIRTRDGWQPFYLKGVNLGAALPGRHPSEFPDGDTYRRWIADMHAMGANVVRTYTIHPPSFYEALAAFNAARPDDPLWLVHGVWTEPPPDDDYEGPAWEGAFFEEMRRVVDLLHGRADLPPRPGHASGSYKADVSRWVLAYIIGREWEPFSVAAFNAMRPRRTAWRGGFLRVGRGSPMEAWLARACERIVAYETATYRAQRPVAYTSWPTLDPLRHPTETTVEEELEIRAARGETVERIPREYDNDLVQLSAASMRATEAFPAGTFAAFHAYPYYPDFMILDERYGRARSGYGRSNYAGYLRDLKAAHPGMPVVIAEYGVPASLGIAHLQPQGQHHGGHAELDMARIDARLTHELAEAGMAGGILFAWIDEWFKKNWITIDFEIPLERNRLWLNRLDAEQHYGVWAMDPGSGPPGAGLAERREAWATRAPLYEGTDGASLRAWADEAYLWLLWEGPVAGDGRRELPALLEVGFDMVDPDAGDRRWPGGAGDPLPVGLEFVLRVDGSGARILADPASDPFRLEPVREGLPLGYARRPDVTADAGDAAVGAPADQPPRGLFHARREQRFNRPFRSLPNADGIYRPLRVITNRPRFARDGTEYLGAGYDRGILPRGAPPDGLWERDAEGGAIEVRIPWGLLNVTDPSQRRVLQERWAEASRDSTGAARPDPQAEGPFGTVTVPDIGIVARWEPSAMARGPGGVWPAAGTAEARFRWETWETPRWRARRRPVFEAMRRAFEELRPRVTDPAAERVVEEGGLR